MEFVIPAVPAVLLLVLQFVSPYIVSLLTAFRWSSATKKLVAVVVSFAISGILLLVALWVGWLPPVITPLDIITLILIGLGLQQAAYGLFFKESADQLTRKAGVGSGNG